MTGPSKKGFDSVEEAIAAIAAGDMVVVTDDASRENEGDLIMAATPITQEQLKQLLQELQASLDLIYQNNFQH